MATTYEFFKINKAICFVQDLNKKDYGYCLLTQYPDHTHVELNLKNLPPGTHGFHIHESVDIRKGFDSLGSHYNPYKKTHGGLNESNNHLGDLGNINIQSDGTCQQKIIVNNLPLVDKGDGIQVIGRSLVIHADPDDYGKGGMTDSLKTGHSGKRIAYGIIGFC